MGTIAQRYRAFKSPYVGSYIVLSKAVRGMKDGKQKITNAFNKLVPKSDYEKEDREKLLQNLHEIALF